MPTLSKCLADARAGVPGAAERLLAALRPFLEAVARKAVPPALAARCGESDLVQESLIDVHRDLGRFVGDSPLQFRAWAKQILKRNVIDALRKHAKGAAAAAPPPPAASPSPSSVVCRAEEGGRVRDAIDALPTESREVVILRVREGLSFVEIARRLGLNSEDTARMRFARAVLALKKSVGHDDDTPH